MAGTSDDTSGHAGRRADAFDKYFRAIASDFPPRNDDERTLVDSAARALDEHDRVVRLQTERVLARIEAAKRRDAEELEHLIERLYGCRNGSIERYGNIKDLPARPRRLDEGFADDPAALIRRIQRSAAGCQWMLNEWASLDTLIEQGAVWGPQHKLKSIRLLGRQPDQAGFHRDVFDILMASWSLDPKRSHPFCELKSELDPVAYMHFVRSLRTTLKHMMDRLDPKVARGSLRSIIRRAVTELEAIAAAARERTAQNEALTADCLSFDHSIEGERLRETELRCFDTFVTALDKLIDLRTSGGASELDATEVRERREPSCAPIHRYANPNEPSFGTA
jgi:hypothetical protein